MKAASRLGRDAAFISGSIPRLRECSICVDEDRKRFHWCRVECVLQLRRRRKNLALDMPCGKTKRYRSFAERIRIEDEVAGSDRAHLHGNVPAIAQRQRVQQMGRLTKVHASEQ